MMQKCSYDAKRALMMQKGLLFLKAGNAGTGQPARPDPSLPAI